MAFYDLVLTGGEPSLVAIVPRLCVLRAECGSSGHSHPGRECILVRYIKIKGLKVLTDIDIGIIIDCAICLTDPNSDFIISVYINPKERFLI